MLSKEVINAISTKEDFFLIFNTVIKDVANLDSYKSLGYENLLKEKASKLGIPLVLDWSAITDEEEESSETQEEPEEESSSSSWED